MAERVSIIEAAAVGGGATFHDHELQAFEKHYLNEGVIEKDAGGLLVSEKGSGANMTVDIAAGDAMVQITNTNTTSETYLVYFENTATKNVPVTTADGTNERLDIVVARVDVSVDPDSVAANIAILEVIAGTPDPSPTAPSVPANAILLATVSIPASDTTISDAQITDGRADVDIQSTVLKSILRQGFLNSFATVGGTGNAVTLTLDPPTTAYTDKFTIVFVATNDNSGPMTVDVDGIGAKTLVKYASEAMENGDIKTGATYIITYHNGDDEFKLASAPSQDVAPFNSNHFGSAVDGSYVLDGTQATVGGIFTKVDSTHYRLDKDVQFQDIQLDSGIFLDTDGFQFNWKGTFTHNGTVQSNGKDGGDGGDGSGSGASSIGGVAGVAGAAAHNGNTLPDPALGKAGGVGGKGGSDQTSSSTPGLPGGSSTGVNKTDALLGSGNTAVTDSGGDGVTTANAAGGDGGNQSPGTGTITEALKMFNSMIIQRIDTARTFNGYAGNAGGGGGGGGGGRNQDGTNHGGAGGGGGGSGSNGGNMDINGATITGTGNFESKGGDGGDGGDGSGGVVNGGNGAGAGGGDGGNGGTINALFDTKTGWSGAFVVTGGVGGAKGADGTGGAGDPADAKAGVVGKAGEVFEYAI